MALDGPDRDPPRFDWELDNDDKADEGEVEVEEEGQKNTLFRVCPFILANEFCERLAFFGLSTNLVIYLTRVMGFDSSNAAAQVIFFEGTCFLTPLLGAWLADSLWGRYKTILFFSYIYLIGLLLLVLSVIAPGLAPVPGQEHANLMQNAALFFALYTIALGTGGIKPNVSAFGADQFDESDEQDAIHKKSFFNWFYFSINLGSFLAGTVIVYVQENISWAIGFLIPAVAMAIAVTLFQLGSGRYSHIKPAQSPITRVVKVIAAALRNRMASENEVESAIANASGAPRYNSPYSNEGAPEFAPVPHNLLDDANGAPPPRVLKRTGSFRWLNKAIMEEAGEGSEIERGLLRSAIGAFTPSQVQEVKLVLRMLPIFFTTIFYWSIYMQMGSLFVQQGAMMDRVLFNGNLVVPAASLSTFNTVAIIVLVPLYDKVFIPALRMCGVRMSMLQRIGWGQLISLLSMLAAAWVEHRRLALVAAGAFVKGDSGPVDMLIWYQTPQYVLIGLSEVFTSIGQLEFFYDQAPDVMRSCSMALQLLTECLGSYSAAAMIFFIQTVTSDHGVGGWLPRDINDGHLDKYFLLLAGAMAVNTLFYLVVANSYEYKEVEHEYKKPRPQPVPVPRQYQPPNGSAPSSSIPIQGGGRRKLKPAKEGPYGRSITYVTDVPTRIR